MKTTKASEIKREWHQINVDGKILGRVSSDIAQLLMGKGKSYFVRNLDCGDYVVVTNAKGIKVTGKKAENKNYYRHSGYPGGFKKETFADLMNRKPEEIIRHAVKGMLPQNRLRDKMLKRLFVFPEAEHKYEDKFKEN
ncbi:MAG: 50S ribosomal protein L13 [Candidatus Levybacteria bacterium]|nr:50S ribosomal protein L13 [Candidatus Levybacteria bacterium]MBI2421130.1 50S ribosomal protein L13 [Candidatus Levybacteria bacterium]